MIAKLIRVEMSSQGALGVLILDHEAFCCTLEPDDADIKKGHIPAGTYECVRFHGTKWPNTFEIKVPGHTAVLLHAGNVEGDTKMCVLLGSSFGKLSGQRAVLNSGATFGVFLNKTKDLARFTLTVEDHL